MIRRERERLENVRVTVISESVAMVNIRFGSFVSPECFDRNESETKVSASLKTEKELRN